MTKKSVVIGLANGLEATPIALLVLGQLEGKGLLKLADGSILKGNFANTAPAGEFEAAYANGESYTGGMQGMNFHGQGYWKSIDGSGVRAGGQFRGCGPRAGGTGG